MRKSWKKVWENRTFIGWVALATLVMMGVTLAATWGNIQAVAFLTVEFFVACTVVSTRLNPVT